MKKTLLLAGSLIWVTASTSTAQTINEVRVDQAGPDDDEYFELVGTPSSSLDGLTYIVIGDGSALAGAIEAIIDLSGTSIGSDGYFLAVQPEFSIGDTADADLVVDSAVMNFENDSSTHMIVSGFTGTLFGDVDSNDDGVLDASPPWTGIIDCLGLFDPTDPDPLYCTAIAGPDGNFAPAHTFYDGNWGIGTYDVTAPGATDTPGSPNATLPVEFVSFRALQSDGIVTLAWTTVTESDNSGFFVEHARNDQFEDIAFVAGSGTTRERVDYRHDVSDLSVGLHRFRLRQVDRDGSFRYSRTIEVTVDLTKSYSLSQAYPNPFNPMTTIEVSVRESQDVEGVAFPVDSTLCRFAGKASRTVERSCS
jgi:hypothetical protein